MILTRKTSVPSVHVGQTNDFGVLIPKGWGIDCIIFHNTTTFEATINGGITPGGSEFFTDAIVSPSTLNGGYTVQGSNFVPDISSEYQLYISGTWNGATVDVYVILKQIF